MQANSYVRSKNETKQLPSLNTKKQKKKGGVPPLFPLACHSLKPVTNKTNTGVTASYPFYLKKTQQLI